MNQGNGFAGTTETIVTILAGVLPPGTTITADTPLAGLNLSSLASARVLLEANAALGVELPMDAVRRCRDARELAALAGAGPPTDGSAAGGPATDPPGGNGLLPVVRAEPELRNEPFPLTPLQEAYLLGKDLGDDPVGCHIYREFEIPDADVSRLRAAWGRLVEHHDALRLTITPDNRQRVLPEAPPWSMPVHDHGDVGAVRDRLSHRPHGRGDCPLWTVEVTGRTDGSAVLHLGIDALVTDGAGLELLVGQLWECYRDPDHDLPTGPFGVRDLVTALAEHRSGPGYRAALDYWAERLRDLPAAPSIGPAPSTGTAPLAAAASAAGAATAAGPEVAPRRPYTATLTAREWSGVTAAAAAAGVSPTSLALTVFAEALHRAAAGPPFSLVLTTNSRLWLPAAADATVGPFTSTAVFVVPPTLGLPLDEAARLVHDHLRRDLDHAVVPGIAAIRELRARRQPVPTALPVVFTSLLDIGGGAADGSFATSQTTGVTLDAQLWERDGELHVRWDVVDDAFPPGLIAAVFGWFVNTLRWVGPQRVADTRPLNELQQAYFVARTTEGTGAWTGCQVCHSFHVTDLDLSRLERAWLGLLVDHEVLRTVVAHDGRLLVRDTAPDRWYVPVTRLPADGSNDTDAVREDMVGRAYPLGRLPQGELRVTVGPDGVSTVHVSLDLLVADGRSIHLMMRELFARYADPSAQRRAVRSYATKPYAAHARQQRELRAGPEHAAAQQHWRDRLADLPPGPPADPGSGPRRRVRFAGRVHGWSRCRDRAAARGVSQDAVVLVALAEALSRHFTDDFALPVVRWTPTAEPFRPGEYTALSWIRRARPGLPVEVAAAGYHRDLVSDAGADAVSGLAELRRLVLRRRRTGDFSYPVVCTGILYLADAALPVGVEAGPWLTCTPDVALDCIAMDDGDDRLKVVWDAAEGVIPDAALADMFAAYTTALQCLADDEAAWSVPHTGREWQLVPEHQTPLTTVGPVELLHRWNDTATDFPHDGPVHLLFEEQARSHPDAVAVRWRGGTMTYGELNATANRIAARLRRAGVRAESVVGISLRRGPAMVAAVFGVLKAGGAYLPIEPSLPTARASVMLADAGATVLLTTSDLAADRAADGVTVIATDRVDGSEPATDPVPVTDSDATAYIIFTSGSTGRPKGVAVAHRAVHNLISWSRRTFGFGPSDVGLCVTSLGFDLSVFDILGILGMGGGIYVADETQQKDPALILDVLLDEPITFWNSAPTALAQVAPLLPAHRDGPGTHDLRLVFLSGDYTPLPLPDEVRATFPGADIISLGGATEATVWSNWFRVGAIDPTWRSIPYGRPMDNTRYYILDDDGRPCGVDVEGDLHIAGEVLSLGYRNRPELTAERFVPDPFVGQGERMYRTGDRASYFPDGTICFRGRADHQVKIRGFRVELGEIEHRLRTHPDVKDVVVLARDDGGERKVVAYVVPAAGRAPGVRELRAHAAETLPDYMVPNHVGLLAGFPATSNGKLDRDRLPWPLSTIQPADTAATDGAVDTGATDGSDPHADGGTVLDPQLLRDELGTLFADLLGEAVDPAVDLWDQGATSFTMVQISARLQERHGQRVPVSVLLENPTVDGIADHLATTLPSPAPPTRAAAPPPAPVVPAAAVPAAGSVDPLSADERAAFAAARWDLRHDADGTGIPGADRTVPLPDIRLSDEQYRWRRTRRDFLDGPVSRESLFALLALLRPTVVDGRPRRLYPSAGDTYGVQVYVHVRGDRVHGLPAGVYYHHPEQHALRSISDGSGIDRSAHFVYNRPVFDRAAFEIYLIGQRRAVAPLYGGADADRFLAIESGYIGQVLMNAQAAHGIGLCPVGGVAFDRIRDGFRLDDGHVFLQSFFGGAALHAPATDGELPPFAHDGRADDLEVAVVGMAGRYPGADDLDGLWRNLSAGRCSIGPLPAERAAGANGTNGHHGDHGDAPPGGYLRDVERFDSMLFGISPAEAATLDPQLRQLLEVVWECMEDAGRTPGSLGRVGVFLGLMWNDHRLVGSDRWRGGEHARISATSSEIANRVSHAFDFRGPSLAVDTSCSSSLTALHLAVESLRRGECDAAVVGAANLMLHPYHAQVLRGLDLIASVPAPQALDGTAGGWSPGEGVGALLLRPAGVARRDRDVVHGIVEGAWVGHSGGTGRFGTPDVDALAGSLAEAVRRAGITPADIGYVECAAAGAALSDAAEIEAIGRLFGDAAEPVPIGTLKPNIGHLESASGLSQLTKVLLQLRHRRLAPTLVAERPTTPVSLTGLAVRFVDRPEPWHATEPDGPLRALVNAVGATGSVGHVVIRSDTRHAEVGR